MANPEHVRLLKQGVHVWNSWRQRNQGVRPDFLEADLAEINLYFRADLRLADFQSAKLVGARLEGANLEGANLNEARLTGASLRKAYCKNASFQNANLTDTNFHRATLVDADLRNADLSRARFDVRNALRAKMQGAVLRDLRSARPETWEMDLGISFLDLVMADGLELVSADSQSFVLEYLSQAFKYAHRPDLDDYEGSGFVREALRRINALRKLYDSRELPSHLIEVVSSINTDLIRSIKANPSDIHKLEWRVFEALIAELLSAYGWKIELTRASKDNGYDIFGIYSDRSGVDHAWLIECKKYSPDRPVGVEIVRSLYGVKTDLRVGNAMLATTSCFTKGAKAFKASRWDFELKDFEAILAWINEYRPNPEGQLHIRDHRLVLPG